MIEDDVHEQSHRSQVSHRSLLSFSRFSPSLRYAEERQMKVGQQTKSRLCSHHYWHTICFCMITPQTAAAPPRPPPRPFPNRLIPEPTSAHLTHHHTKGIMGNSNDSNVFMLWECSITPCVFHHAHTPLLDHHSSCVYSKRPQQCFSDPDIRPVLLNCAVDEFSVRAGLRVVHL